MAELYRNPALGAGPKGDNANPTYIEPDTNVPAKPKAVIKDVSVNGKMITEQEIMEEAQNHPAETPGAALAEAARALCVRELLRQEALSSQLQADPQTLEDGRQETLEDAQIRQLLDIAVEAPTSTEEECRSYYERNAKRFRSAPLSEARHILIAVKAERGQKHDIARMQAERIVALLKENPERFAELATAHSDCPSNLSGGSLGQLSPGSTVPEFEAGLRLIDGNDNRPHIIESKFGYHVVVLDRRIEGEQLPFEAVQVRIAAWLEASSWSRAVAQYISILARRAQIEGINFDDACDPLVN